MLDLPLRSGEGQAELPFATPDQGPDEPPPPPPRRRKRRPASRHRLLLIGLGAVLGLLGAYLVFWPKPPEPQFSASPFVMDKVRLGRQGEPQTLTVTNIGELPMPVAMLSLTGSDSGEFKIEDDECGTVLLEPAQSCAVQIRFTPAEKGLRRAVLELHAEMPDSPALVDVSGEGTAPVLGVNPVSLNFGAFDVGDSSGAGELQVVNKGTAPLEIEKVTLGGSAERDFRVTRNDCSRQTLAPAERCDLSLMFVPRAAGKRPAELVFTSDALEPVPSVALEGEGIWTGAAFDVQPRSLDFGRHLVGTGRLSKRVQLTNRQGTTLSGIRVGLAREAKGFAVGQQDCTGRPLGPGEGCRIEVVFGAPEEGEFRSLLQISQGDAGTLGIDIRGLGVAPRWVLGAESLDFGDLRVGSEASEPLAVELRNEGSAGARVERVEVSGTDATAFVIDSDRCVRQAVEPGSSCTVRLRFEPKREGAHQAELLLEVEAGPSPQRIAIAARAVAPRLGIDREMVDFDRIRRTTSGEVVLTLSNRGTAPLRLGPLTISEDGSGNFRVGGGSCVDLDTLPPGQQCNVGVIFAPTLEGRTTAQLEIEHDGISGPRSLPLAGVGLPPPMPRITLGETTVDFGPQPVGSRSSIQTVNVQAGGTGNLEFEGFVLTGPHAGDFRIVPATCHAAPFLQPGTACAVGLRFTPSAAGPRSAELLIRHNAGSGTSSIGLEGEGLGAPPG